MDNYEKKILAKIILGTADTADVDVRRLSTIGNEVFQAMKNLKQAEIPIDHMSLGNELQILGKLDFIGGAIALANLTDDYFKNQIMEMAAEFYRSKGCRAPDAWCALVDYLGEKGIDLKDAEAAGLAMKRRIGKGYYDRWRAREVSIWTDEDGNISINGGKYIK